MIKKAIYVLIIIGLVFGAIGFQPPKPVQAANPLRISQVYGGGGPAGSYRQHFVELFNSSSSPVSLENLTLQLGSTRKNIGADGVIPLANGIVPANGYFLIQLHQAAEEGVDMPTADLVSNGHPINWTTGKIAVVTGPESMSCGGTIEGGSPCSDEQLARLVDFVGYGENTTYREGDANAIGHTQTTSTQRKNAGCQDTDQNGDDFEELAPNARNSASPAHSCAPAGNPDAIFFSEYVEGSGQNKALEIYNGTGDEVALSDIKVELYSNGASAPSRSVVLSGILADKGTFVIAHNQADATVQALAQLIDGNITAYNGDDALVLRRVSNDTVLDTIGQVGHRPASPAYWGSGDVTTVDHTLVRKPEVCAGDTVPNDPYDPIPEWLGYPQNTFTHLGSHESTCNQVPVSGPKVQSIVPANNSVVPGTTDIVITFSETVTVAEGWYDITCAQSGAHTAVVTDANPVFTLNPDTDFTAGETCTVTIDKDKVTNAATEAMAENYVSSFSIVEGCGDAFTAIYAIQGDGAASPVVNQIVTTEGVVTANFQVGGKRGYNIQDPDGDGNTATSDGIFVYSTSPEVNVGDRLRITGKVTEYYNMTQLTPTSAATVLTCSTGHEVTPTEITLPVTAPRDFEQFEGMLVTFPQYLTISEYFNYDRYGEIVLSGSRHNTPTSVVEPGADAIAAEEAYQLDSIKVDDTLTTQNPPYLRHPDGTQFTKEHYFRGGDLVYGMTGIMDYNFNEWKIQPVGTAYYAPFNLRPDAPQMEEGEIRIASMNVLNYFVTIDNAGNICGPGGNVNCRGADTPEEFERQHTKIVKAIVGMEADVIGLMEIENEHPAMEADGAVKNLVEGLNAETAAGTYAYVPTGVIGTDAIKQAIIYKPAKVDFVGAFATLDETFDPGFDTTKNRPSLAASFKDKITQEIFTVSVNHLKSKGSACDGDPDLGDGQGNCNLTRKAAAEALVKWLETDPTQAGSGMYVIIGDLNSYAKEDPIDAIKLGADKTADTADDVINLVERFNGPDVYGYVFDGKAGYLDHALANKKFTNYVLDAKFWNINSDEPDVFDYDMTFKPDEQDALYSPTAYRSSDHDPVLISLILNHPPVANDDEYSTPVNTTLEVASPGVMANDTDANYYDGKWVELDNDNLPQHGEATLLPDGSLKYVPETNFVGTDTFKYIFHAEPSLMDAYSDTATVTINVVSDNLPPVFTYPIEDATIDELTNVEYNFKAVDSDTLPKTVTYTIENLPEGATFSPLTAKFSWTPTEAQGPGVYTITVTACDAATPPACATAEVTITVNEVNQTPVLEAIEDKTVFEGELVSFTASATDADLPAQTLTFSLENAPEGAAIDPATGEFSWTPTTAQVGVHEVTVKVCDNFDPAACATRVVKITVNKINQPPVFVYPIEDATIDELTNVEYNFKAVDSDTLPRTVTYTIENLPEGATFSPLTAKFSWTPTEAQGPGVYTITVTACDAATPPACATAEVTITVNEVNLPPVIASIPPKTVDEEATLTFTATATDPDIPANTLSFSLEDAPAGATIDSETGVFSWTPDNTMGTQDYTFKVCVSDGMAKTCTTVVVTVNNVDYAPIAVDDAYTTDEDVELVVAAPGILENDSDPNNDEITAVLVENPGHGTLVLSADGSFTYTPELNYHGTDSFTYKATDGTNESEVATVTITINSVNDAPVAEDDTYTVDEDAVLTVAAPGVMENDSDVDGDALSVSLRSNVSNGTLTLISDGSFTYTPNANFNGTDSFTYNLNSSPQPMSGWTDWATVTITVTPVNDAPELDPINDATMPELEPIGIMATVYDPDSENFTFSLINGPEGATIHPELGIFAWTPTEAQGPGVYTFSIKVCDDGTPSLCDQEEVTLTIEEVNLAPELDPIGNKEIDEGVEFTFTATATDPDLPEQSLIYSMVDAPEGAVIDSETGTFTWTPTRAQVGEHTIKICVSDGELEDCETITITVKLVNQAPVAVADAYSTMKNEELEVAAPGVLENDTDADGDDLTAVLGETVQHGILVLNADGSFTYTPEEDFVGEDSFTYQAFDGNDHSELVTVTITVVAPPVWHLYFPIIIPGGF